MKRVNMVFRTLGRLRYGFSKSFDFKNGRKDIFYLYHPTISIMNRIIYLHDDKEKPRLPYQAYLYEHYIFGENNEES